MILPSIQYALMDFEIPSTKVIIKLRQMLAREEKLLLMAKESNDDTKALDIQNAIKQVVNNCIVTPNVDIDQFTLCDLTFAFIRLRAFSAASTTKVSYTDTDDDKVYSFDINLDQVKIEYPKATSNIVAVDDKISLILRYPRASLYTDKAFLESKTTIEAAEFIIINCIESVRSLGEIFTPTTEELKGFIDGLPLKAYKEVSDFIANMPSVLYEISYTNANGKKRKIRLSTLSDFFMLA